MGNGRWYVCDHDARLPAPWFADRLRALPPLPGLPTRRGASYMELSQADVTLLLKQLSAGDKSVLHQLVPVVYGELRRLASSYMRHERPDPLLQTTALV